MGHWEDQYREWVYRFRIEHPIHTDAVMLVCVRNRYVDDRWENEVLTTEGWWRYRDYETLPSNLPKMTGLEMRSDQLAVKRLLDGVRGVLEASGAEDIRVEV